MRVGDAMSGDEITCWVVKDVRNGAYYTSRPHPVSMWVPYFTKDINKALLWSDEEHAKLRAAQWTDRQGARPRRVCFVYAVIATPGDTPLVLDKSPVKGATVVMVK
jgi:hypothetical protein